MASSNTNDSKAAILARIQRTEVYAEGVRRAFAKTVNAILALNKTMPTLDEGEMYSFDAQKESMQKKVEALLRQLHSVVTTAIKTAKYILLLFEFILFLLIKSLIFSVRVLDERIKFNSCFC